MRRSEIRKTGFVSGLLESDVNVLGSAAEALSNLIHSRPSDHVTRQEMTNAGVQNWMISYIFNSTGKSLAIEKNIEEIKFIQSLIEWLFKFRSGLIITIEASVDTKTLRA